MRHSPTLNEIGHVPAGIVHWRYQRFELYRVNPPLPRLCATFPLLFCDINTDWSHYDTATFARDEVPEGIRFTRVNGARTFTIFTIARWGCIPFSLLGAWVCYRWAREVWGGPSAWIALLLWCTNPFILGHGPLVMPDVPAAALGVAACYLFRGWLRQPEWRRAAGAGVVFGLAALSKLTLLIFVPLWPAIWCASVIHGGWRGGSCGRQLAMMAAMAGLALVVVNVGYGFVGTGQRLGDYGFQSRLFGGAPEGGSLVGNRCGGTWVAAMPVPLPRDYLLGIDCQRKDFEEGGRSYLRGRWQDRGWWHYHLYGLAIKTPTGTLLLLATAALATGLLRGYRGPLIEELCLLVPAVGVLALVSSQTGFSDHVRYTVPALPFLFVWVSKLGRAFARRNRLVACAAGVGTLATTIGSLGVYPHSLSYFNELVGGPRNGHHYLLGSNISWCQDLLILREWMDEHPEASPIGLASSGWTHPHLAGIGFSLPPVGPKGPDRNDGETLKAELGPRPGWYAIDVNFLHGRLCDAANEEGGWTRVAPSGPNYEYFLRFRPVDRAGYSILIFHITPEDADAARSELGLPPLVTP